MIQIGDRVKFISDTYVGEVVTIKGLIAEVSVEDGFIVPTMLSDLVVVNKQDEIDAMRKFGVSDERPGTNKGSTQKTTKKPHAPKREAAYLKYGKISLVDDLEDDEDIINISDLRAIYAKSVANINAKEIESASSEKIKKSSWTENSKIQTPANTSTEVFETEKTKEVQDNKMRQISLDSLDKELNVKLEKTPIQQQKPKNNDIEVVDLHANEILESTAGMTSGEILNSQISRFNIALSLCLKKGKHGKIVFIHGVGSGKLKYELQKELSRNYPKLNSQDASFKEYGYGAIMIFY